MGFSMWRPGPTSRPSPHLIQGHLPGGVGGLGLHVEVHGGVLGQRVPQVHQVVVQPLLQLQHHDLLDAGAVHLVADLHTWPATHRELERFTHSSADKSRTGGRYGHFLCY